MSPGRFAYIAGVAPCFDWLCPDCTSVALFLRPVTGLDYLSMWNIPLLCVSLGFMILLKWSVCSRDS